MTAPMTEQEIEKALELARYTVVTYGDDPNFADSNGVVIARALIACREPEPVTSMLSLGGAWHQCSGCGSGWMREGYNFCPNCGRRIAWPTT